MNSEFKPLNVISLYLFQGDASRSDIDDDMSSDYGDEDKLRELLKSGVCARACLRAQLFVCFIILC